MLNISFVLFAICVKYFEYSLSILCPHFKPMIVVAWSWSQMMLFFSIQEIFNFTRFHLLSVDLGFLLCHLAQAYTPHCSSIIFKVSSLMLRYLIHLDWSLVQDDNCGDICILLHIDIQCDQSHF